MGTTWSAKFVERPPPPPRPSIGSARTGIEAALLATLDRVVGEMSQWALDSALSRFNRSAIDAWQALPADLMLVLDTALDIGTRSGGAFDPACGALADLWGFGPPGPRAGMPTDVEIERALARSGAGGIERSGARARRAADVALDLSGIAKGFAVDALTATLRATGIADFLVEIGGEFVGAGIKPDGQPWWVDLEAPPGIALPPLRVALHGLAVATSGDYRRFVAVGSKRLGHTLDPRTGRPIANGVVSTSVIAADCLTADAWATALTVLGQAEGMRVAEREGLAARIVTDDRREGLSPALSAMLE